MAMSCSETLPLFASPEENRLSVLSFGAGHDSSALLELYLDDAAFRKRYAPNDFLVIFSDTMDEYPETYRHLEDTKKKCAGAGVEFVHLKPEMGYHSQSWQGLREFYREKTAIGSVAYPKTCSIQLKQTPIYRFLERWISDRYGVRHGRKQGYREFAETHGKIQMIIGIAKGEERRVANAKKSPQRWYREAIEPIYPLIDLGMDRQACIDLLESKSLHVIPSNCRCCPFLSLEELEYLRRFEPESLADWVSMEAAKLEKYRDRESVIVTDKDGSPKRNRDGSIKTANKNYGVFGVKPLPVKIQEAAKRFSDWSDARVREYRYSHGHCVATVY